MKNSISAWFDRWRGRSGMDEALCELPLPMPLAQAQRVLVLAPHPDDECIGCGGALALLARRQVPLRVVLISDGGGAGSLPHGAAAVRQQEFRAATTRLGVQEVSLLGFPDGALMLNAQLCSAVEREVRQFRPNWILAPAPVDLHRDHRVVAEAARRAAQRHLCVAALWHYETWSPLPISHVLDITEVMDTKLLALAEHRTALAHGNYVDATRGLAQHRGMLLGARHAGAVAEGYLLAQRESRFELAGAPSL